MIFDIDASIQSIIFKLHCYRVAIMDIGFIKSEEEISKILMKVFLFIFILIA